MTLSIMVVGFFSVYCMLVTIYLRLYPVRG